ncbi:MAG TPA: TIGR04190 family B12-binding domain/radical SAM domain protein [Gemmatimonadales bacterium]|nr:TIGR04190 family B12-binding domain/radical SAM domain protein [Gemmatimonadales bacterium]
MSRYDVVLLHPPSIYDFRERPAFYGPIADVIPSSPVFEMYPMGFVTLAAHLRRHGFRVRIVNLALLMMRDRTFDVDRFLRRLRPRLFGIDLHWLPHAHGSLEVARRLKEIHPDIPTVFGGISSTYYHEELIQRPEVDFVLRGSVCEPFLLALVRQLAGARDFATVPSLTWKEGGAVRVNPAGPTPGGLDDYPIDLGMMIRQVVGHLDFWSNVPFHHWWRHPITAVFTVRGCGHGCLTCGAADAAFRRFMAARHPFYRRPEGIAAMVRQFATLTRAPIFLVGDVLDGGMEYACAVLDALAASPVPNRVGFEFFAPPPAEFIERLRASVPRWFAELSPESHDESVRATLGKARYSNAELEAAIGTLLANGCEGLDLFFMVGLPGQTYENVMAGMDYVADLFTRFDRRLSAFITPMGPFLDPGSDTFERAEELGYRRFAHTLEEHRLLLETRDWEHMLSYETRWMTRAQLVDATYDAAERLSAAKVRTGRVSPEAGARVGERIATARDIRRRLRANPGNPGATQRGEPQLRADIAALASAMLHDKRELFPPAAFLNQFRLGGIARILLQDLFGRGRSRA